MADAVFMNKEEVDLVPIYYDPVHDFGFYRFDPKAVKFMEVAEIELNPEGAKVGVEIRVVGNDSGEKLRHVQYRCCGLGMGRPLLLSSLVVRQSSLSLSLSLS